MIPSPHDGMSDDDAMTRVSAIPLSLWNEVAAAARTHDVMIHITITPYERDVDVDAGPPGSDER